MPRAAQVGKTVLIWAMLLAPALHAEKGFLSFVFGPSSPDAAKQSSRAAAAAARHWMQTGGGVVEIRRPGAATAQQIDAATDSRRLEQAFADAVRAARDADPASFVMALDATAQATSLRAGMRVVVAVLNSPSFSSDGERTLESLAEICRAHGVRVLVLDVADDSKHVPVAGLHALVEKTGGAWLRAAKDLEPEVGKQSPPPASTAPPAPPAPAESAPKPAEEKPSTGFNIPFAIPVHISLTLTSPGTASKSETVADSTGFGDPIIVVSAQDAIAALEATGSMDAADWPNDPHSPLQGEITIETPLTAFRFDKDETAGSYHGHAHIAAIVQDGKGAVVWSGQKDVDLHGPLPKLASRREGSIYFMRAVTVVGQGPFSMAAKVEDVVGQTSGTAAAPVRVGRNAPGLTVTDATVVRQFKNSADAFETDQMLTYEGDALSPVMDPVFPADQPINMQIYLRLNADLHTTPLDMSMEVLSDGKALAQMELPVKSLLSSSAREGASELPYLVNMKGARFPAGNYEGIISIHQGKNTIRRTIAFKVVGNGTAAPAQAGAGPKISVEEAEPIVLPEVAPATVDTTGIKMSDVEQKTLWDSAAKNAMGYLAQLPNFVCIQETHRFKAPAKTPSQLAEADSYLDQLVFEDGRERYQRLETNGEKVDMAPIEQKGVSSRNEFGSLLRSVFDPQSAASYRWAGRAMTLGVLCQVFEFDVARAKSNFVLHSGNNVETAAYSGRVFIDEDSGMVRRLTIEGTGLSKDFGLQAPAISLDYGMVKIGEKDYLLPLRSVLQLRQSKTFVRNESVFRGYRKWQAASQIKFGKQN